MKASVKEICSFLDRAIPLSYQANYDNAGLQIFSGDKEITSALLAVDITEEVLDEAITLGCSLIITHHPLIFFPIKKITGMSHTERIIINALKNNISVYSAHTNLDSAPGGVSWKMAEKLSLRNVRVLAPMKNRLMKLIAYIPQGYIEKVSKAVFEAGAGVTGNYDRCSFNAPGYGTFRGNESSSPFVGEKGKVHQENEIRFETVLQSHQKDEVVKALLDAHPYEEVAYDLYTLENDFQGAGEGCIGELEQELAELDFLLKLSEIFGAEGIRYSALRNRMVKKVAMCGGAGSAFIGDAIRSGADVYITGDLKYHDFGNITGEILLADIGHFEGEKFSTEILYDLIIKKFPTFALRFSEKNTNPINYL
ncbi:MAG: Nif3-like dinuclear metal center hexameric protein [Bacteroidales bacterium]|jgi:dinuclear metal center YbgI/SA1388 family protein